MRGRKILLVVFIVVFAVAAIYAWYPYSPMPAGTQIDKLVVQKSQRQLLAYEKGKLVKTFPISLGRNPIGAKEFEGDKKTPEGTYFISAKNPNSGYHKNLGVSYPNQQNLERAKQLGKPAGGDIKIHALRNYTGFIGRFQRCYDWTLGCIALTNAEIDDLYAHTAVGTPIIILP
ncbi:murein L,D-transpeptidase YafK [Filimonas zeae]|uniref:L,D-TPase catalytic domain-containing protein n=1 Tax=Filimonas zeae TaxID=1737353 RepID=A0A917IYW2_9BACT|nr:L,D-transpeptidase [Filimonas zeae]MDR6339859.1 murein L,D-transpeptidase YafK [Filimonas zeae]GGH70000.1 hypothetical protein GCM10011379_27850 [Filimonas zeae]